METREVQCREAKRLLSMRLDEVLATGPARQLEAHLKTCNSCAWYGCQLEQLGTILGDAPADGAPMDITAEVMRCLPVSSAARRSQVPVRPIALAAIACAVTIAVVLAVATEIGSSGFAIVAGTLLASAASVMIEIIEIGAAGLELAALAADMLLLIATSGPAAVIANGAVLAAAAITILAFGSRETRPA